MLVLLLLLYLLPVYLVFFRFKLLTLTPFWRVFLWIPPLLAAIFLWFALGRYTPTVATAYVQAPVVQVAAVQQVHLERMQARAASANLNLEKRYAMNSTICKRHNWVAQ